MKVVVGLSGGVDSAVTAYLLKKQGYKVYGIAMIHIDDFDTDRVKYVAKILDIPLFIYDIRGEFKKRIITPFIEEYTKGRTPNPCVMCNPIIKFGIIKEYAKKYGELFATGHYVRKEKRGNLYFIKKGVDKKKDQSYFLYRLTQKDMEDVIFPLGEYTKEKVKEIAYNILKIPPKKESQDICFIKQSYQEFIKKYIHDLREGNFVTKDGEILGRHKGIPFYTVGQRRGLGISSSERLYVIKILPEENKILLGPKKELIKRKFLIHKITSPSYKRLPEGKIYKVKIRYNTEGKMAKIKYISEEKVEVTFVEEGEYGITPGQSAVFYEEEYLIGGGIILP